MSQRNGFAPGVVPAVIISYAPDLSGSHHPRFSRYQRRLTHTLLEFEARTPAQPTYLGRIERVAHIVSLAVSNVRHEIAWSIEFVEDELDDGKI
jgi:hypothetical protein